MEGTNIEEIKGLVEEYNRAENGFYLLEVSLHEIFGQGGELTEQNLPLRLCSVNGFMGANVKYGDMHKIFNKIVHNLVFVNEGIAQVRDFDYLNGDIGQVREVVPDTFTLICEAAGNHPVFAAKFFHWCAPKAFPVVDRTNVPGVIREFQEGNGWMENQMIPANGILHPNDYENLIHFYKKFIVEMSEHNAGIEALIQYDYNTQPEGFRHLNTILRVLDKFFWMKGREITQ